ncbi:hypothetical protein [Sphingobium sp. TCM1]|jgi:hypothetical protein|uniref:hypothetical protein n=1 Tax=Sphingobium sp. TCM1 TaxID=453246 RepID=UPI0018DEAA81|nr:hypothetical protein [Sphingobium sp. TCM1]
MPPDRDAPPCADPALDKGVGDGRHFLGRPTAIPDTVAQPQKDVHVFLSSQPVTGAIINDSAWFPAPLPGKEGRRTAFDGNPPQLCLTGMVAF